MQFALICRDAPGMLDRRLKARANHMTMLQVEKKAGRMRDGGAITDSDGNMIGSVVLCEFESREDLDAYLSREIYAVTGVWEDVEILPMRFVDWEALMKNGPIGTAPSQLSERN